MYGILLSNLRHSTNDKEINTAIKTLPKLRKICLLYGLLFILIWSIYGIISYYLFNIDFWGKAFLVSMFPVNCLITMGIHDWCHDLLERYFRELKFNIFLYVASKQKSEPEGEFVDVLKELCLYPGRIKDAFMFTIGDNKHEYIPNHYFARMLTNKLTPIYLRASEDEDVSPISAFQQAFQYCMEKDDFKTITCDPEHAQRFVLGLIFSLCN